MKKMILLCALCLFGAGVVFGQAYSDLLYRDWAGLRAYAQVNKTLGDVRPDVVFMGNSSWGPGRCAARGRAPARLEIVRIYYSRKTTSWAAASAGRPRRKCWCASART